jgi:flagellar motility protein MotE (MotC chaperone)
MEILSSAYFVGNFFAITLPILVSVWLGNRQTQKIIRNTNEQTQRVIQEIVQNTSKQTQRVIREIVENTNSQTLKVLNEIKELQQDMKCLLEKTHALQKDTLCVLRKLDFGFKANALMHGWRRADGISPEEAAKLPEPKIYDATLRVCYYKAD